MAEDIRIDSHKLIYHPQRVAEWMNGQMIYPLEAEIAPAGHCNHRCVFCALDYMEYKPALLDKDMILGNLKLMAEKGLKSIILAGEGEPLLNKHTPEIINRTKEMGVDVAMSSNGVLLTENIAEECLKSLTWIRFSVGAGTDETYNKIHQCKPGDFKKAIDNISTAVKVKIRNNLHTTIGVQLLLLPENTGEVLALAKILKDIGVDYFTVKPFSKHPLSNCSVSPDFDYQGYLDLENKLKDLTSETYSIFFRTWAMNKKKQRKQYDHCLGLPFFTYIDAKGQVWPCIAFLGQDKHCFGNLYNQSFVEIWEGKKRSQVMSVFNKMDITNCRELCRLDEINAYLHQLKNPGRHVNFI